MTKTKQILTRAALTVGLLLAVPSITAAQDVTMAAPGTSQFRLFVCVGRAPSDIPNAKAQSQPSTTSTDCDLFQPSGVPAWTTTNRDFSDRIIGGTNQWILVRFAANISAPTEDPAKANLNRVVITAGNISVERALGGTGVSLINNTLAIPLKDFEAVPNGTLVTVRVDFKVDPATNTAPAPATTYFTLRNVVSPYGLAESGAYAWVPIGLFATNFQSTADGLPLSAFPIGLAAGFRLAPFSKKTFYFGLSGMINWAIYASPKAGTAEGSDFNLKSGAVGGLLDVNNMVYVGGAYVVDFRKEHESPGAAFVVGAGPGLLQFLQGARQ